MRTLLCVYLDKIPAGKPAENGMVSKSAMSRPVSRISHQSIWARAPGSSGKAQGTKQQQIYIRKIEEIFRRCGRDLRK